MTNDASNTDDGVQLIDVSDPSSPVAVGSATDGVNGFDELDGPQGVATFVIGTSTYAIVASNIDDGVQLLQVGASLVDSPQPPPLPPSPPATPPAPPAPPLAPYFDACYGQSCQGELPHLISACSTLIGNLGSTSSASCSTSCFASANCDMWLMSSSGACQLYTLSIGCTVQWHCGPSNWDGCVKQSSIANKSLAIPRIEDVG
mgnify:CR=1 FL=1